jgi:ribulose-phosphate 3-epimerase
MRPLTAKPFDCHLMIEHPETQIAAFKDAGADRITVHVEACPHLHRVLQEVRSAGLLAGVAVNPATPADAVAHVLDLVDLVLVMTVNPGWGGQEFIAGCLDKVRQVREWAPHHFIQVDGGIDDKTIGAAMLAGANCFVAGSYTFSGEPSERLGSLRKALWDVSAL